MNGLTELLAQIQCAAPSLPVCQCEPLSRHTSFRIGGPATLLALPRTEDELRVLLAACGAQGIRPVLLGAGTNVLAPDEGLDTLVICTKDNLGGLQQPLPGVIAAGAGVTLARLASFACGCGLSGLEFAHGIPGTVGGATLMNAGAYGGEMSQVQTRTWLMRPDGSVDCFEGTAQGFGYRASAFEAEPGVVLRAEYCLRPDNPACIRDRMQDLARRRSASQPLSQPSAGSTFKRPQGGYAAALIDQAGLKGAQIGGAQVSPKHAGFIVNTGGATARDVRALMELVQRDVCRTSGIWLEPEVRIL